MKTIAAVALMLVSVVGAGAQQDHKWPDVKWLDGPCLDYKMVSGKKVYIDTNKICSPGPNGGSDGNWVCPYGYSVIENRGAHWCKLLLTIMAAGAQQGDTNITSPTSVRIDTNPLPPCAFGLSRVEVIYEPKPAPPKPSINAYIPVPNEPGGMITSEYRLFRDKPPTRMACPYERAIALYGDERVRYLPPGSNGALSIVSQGILSPATVEVCDEDGKSNCVVVYTEPEEKR